MDPRTGKFTAPLAGTYMFIVHVCSADYRKALLSIRFVKFVFFEKATNFDEISALLLTNKMSEL